MLHNAFLKPYTENKQLNLIAAHLGGGISISLHKRGRMVDIVSDSEGVFSPERSGALPSEDLMALCYEKIEEERIPKMREYSNNTPLNVGDTVICMGAGISAGLGFEKVIKMANRDQKVFGFIGDLTFFHSGITGLIDAVYNKSNIAIVIFDNRITAMTGQQDNPGTGKTAMGEPAPVVDIEKIVQDVGIKDENIRVIDPYKLDETKSAVKDAYESDDLFVIITKQPCALIKNVQKARKDLYCEVNQEKCTKCKTYLKIGCPAISIRDNVVGIDENQCNGCKVCFQVCPFDAIEYPGEVGD